MMLRKTTILPTDDQDLALRLLRQLVFEEPHVLMVVLGSDEIAERCVARADKLAGKPEEPRWVVWVRNPDLVREVLDELQVQKGQRTKLKTAVACALSLTDRVRDIVPRDPEPDLFRIYEAFENAEANLDG